MADDIPQAAELSPTCVRALVDAFLADLTEQGRKAATVKHYTKRLKPFVAKFGLREFATLEPLEIKSYMSQVNRYPAGHKKAGELMANSTRASNAIVLELLQDFAIEVRAIPGKILPRLEKPLGRRREVVPTVDEVNRMMKAAAPAAALLIKALNQCGARPSELTGAKISDWHRNDNEIVLTEHKTSAATGESRVIGVGKVFARTLAKAAGDRGPDGNLFLNTEGKPWTVDSLAKYVNRLRKRLGIREGVVPYGLRHKFLTELCEVASLEDAADAANHKKLDTTRVYVHKDRKRRGETQDLINHDDEDELPAAA